MVSVVAMTRFVFSTLVVPWHYFLSTGPVSRRSLIRHPVSSP